MGQNEVTKDNQNSSQYLESCQTNNEPLIDDCELATMDDPRYQPDGDYAGEVMWDIPPKVMWDIPPKVVKVPAKKKSRAQQKAESDAAVDAFLAGGGGFSEEQRARLQQYEPEEGEPAYKNLVRESKITRLPLRRSRPPSDPFPFDALPPALRGIAKVMTATVQAPDAVIGSSLLAASSLAVQGHADVSLDGRTMPTSLYLVSVASSGDRKTAIDDLALAPHHKKQRQLIDEYLVSRAEYDREFKSWKRSEEKILKNGKLDRNMIKAELENLGPSPRAPLEPLIMLSEPSYESLIKSLQAGQPSQGLFSDEGGRMIGGYAMSSDNALKTVCGLSELWQGKATTRSRVGDGTSVLYGRRLSMHLMIQPPVLPLLMGNDLVAGQGFTARLLMAHPTSTVGERPYSEVNIRQTPEFLRYFARVMDLLEAPFPLADGKQNELEPRRLELEPDAKQTLINFHDHIEMLMKTNLETVQAFACKTVEHALRIAGVLSLFEDIRATKISLDNVKAGIALAQYYLNEAIRLTGEASEEQELALAEKCLAWAVKRDEPFSKADLYQKGPPKVRSKASAEVVLATLLEHGQIRKSGEGWEVAS